MGARSRDALRATMSQNAARNSHDFECLRRVRLGRRKRRQLARAFVGPALVGLALVALGCGSVGDEPLATVSEAVNVCDETVPDNRYVDGLPAYAQCDTTTGSIWSNNGIDTATSSQGSDWVRTQQGGGYQCTEWAYRYMHFRWNIDYRHGDAREWCDGMLPATLVKSSTPVHGDLIVFDGGVCGADATTGHIAVVDTFDTAKAKVTIVEENRAGRRATDQSCATCFLHAVANDGSVSGGAGSGSAGMSGSAAGSGNAGMTGGGGAPGAGGSLGAAGRGGGARGGAGNAEGGTDTGGRATGGGGSGGDATGRSGSGSGAAGGQVTGSGGQSGLGAGSGSVATGSGGTGTDQGHGGTGASTGVGAGAPGVAGRGAGANDGAHANNLALSETNDGSGCAVRHGRANGSAWLLFVALALGSLARRRRSGAEAC